MREAAHFLSAAMLLVAQAAPTLAAAPAGTARAQAPRGATRCDFTAWVPFQARAPIAVRAGPKATAKHIGSLPILPDTDEDASAVEFHVVAARPGWLKIDDMTDPVELDARGDPIPPRPLPQGAGWIADDAAQIGIQSALGHARPDAASPLLVDLGDDWLTDMGRIDAIRGCAGEWVLLDYHITHERSATDALVDLPEDGQPKGTAWFRGICANQKTTCDMASVDRRE